MKDPTSRRAVPEEVSALLVTVLKELSEREQAVLIARFGLADGYPLTLGEIGNIHGVTRERIRQIEVKVMSKLRHPRRAQILAPFLGEDFVNVPDHIRERIYGRRNQAEQSELIHCDRHGWFDPGPRSALVSRATCDGCPCPLAENWTGRPRAYCSDACRQAAYRMRKTAKRNAGRQTTRRRRSAGKSDGLGAS